MFSTYPTRKYLESTFDTDDDYSYPGELYDGAPLGMYYLECDMRDMIPGYDCFDPAKHPLLEPELPPEAYEECLKVLTMMRLREFVNDKKLLILHIILLRTVKRDYAAMYLPVKELWEGSDMRMTSNGLMVPACAGLKEDMSYSTCNKYFKELVRDSIIVQCKNTKFVSVYGPEFNRVGRMYIDVFDKLIAEKAEPSEESRNT